MIAARLRRVARRLRRKPELTVVVVFYDMAREAPRTLQALSAAYQRGIDEADYEVIAIDNGSPTPLDPALVAACGGNVRLLRIDRASASPVAAVNRGLAMARGGLVGVMIDGARLATPGLLAEARRAAGLATRPVVTPLGWYLGFDFQRFAPRPGEERAAEDRLLERIDWPRNGYRLFDVGTPDDSNWDGWFGPINECNALFLRKGDWHRLGGYDERFDAPGGGLANLDTYARALALPGARQVILLGEATFHQWHGGTATNAPQQELDRQLGLWTAQYRAIRGTDWQTPKPRRTPLVLGTLRRGELRHFMRSALYPIRHRPLGRDFDPLAWTAGSPAPQAPIRPLYELASTELQAGRPEAAVRVLRLARAAAPDDRATARLLSHLAGAVETAEPVGAEEHAALAEALAFLGEGERAEEYLHRALALDPGLERAHYDLARVRMPGDGYLAWLERLHGALRPRSYLEIGVETGRSLACARSGTLAIGLDPVMQPRTRLAAEARLFPETSEAFFARGALAGILQGRPLDLGFVDGSHVFRDALRDVGNLMAHAGPRTLLLLHDTIPLDEATQRPERQHGFYTGDVWRVVPCLAALRPDLEIFTVRTAPSGLTFVCGFGPDEASRPPPDEDTVASFAAMPYAALDEARETLLRLEANDWGAVEARLRRAGPLWGDGMTGAEGGS